MSTLSKTTKNITKQQLYKYYIEKLKLKRSNTFELLLNHKNNIQFEQTGFKMTSVKQVPYNEHAERALVSRAEP